MKTLGPTHSYSAYNMERAIREYKNEVDSSKDPGTNAGNILVDLAASRRRQRLLSTEVSLQGDYETGQLKARRSRVLPDCNSEEFEVWDPKPYLKIQSAPTGISNRVFQAKLKSHLEDTLTSEHVADVVSAAEKLGYVDPIVYAGAPKSSDQHCDSSVVAALNEAVADEFGYHGAVAYAGNTESTRGPNADSNNTSMMDVDHDTTIQKKIIVNPVNVELSNDTMIQPGGSLWLPDGKVIGSLCYRGGKTREDFHVVISTDVIVSGQRNISRVENRLFFGEAIMFFGCTYNGTPYHLALCRVYHVEKSRKFHCKNISAQPKYTVVDVRAIQNIAGLVVGKTKHYYIHDDDDISLDFVEKGELRQLS
jgi:hypothetical protein